MKFVIAAAFQPLDHLAPIARVAEECGFEALAFSDHVVYPEKLDTPYPYTPDGSRRYDETSLFPDPWVAIGALAAVTTRLRFTTNVFVLPMRNLFAAAKAVATAAVLSGDRVTLTVGVGWSKVEFDLLGQDFGTRGRRTDEMLALLPELWSGRWVEHHGRFHDFPRLCMNPVPSAPIPIWIGGISDAALRRAARHDGWLSDLQTSDEIAGSIAKLRRFRDEIGRGDAPFDVMASASDAFTVDHYRRLSDAGVTHVLTMPWVMSAGLTADLDPKCDGIRRFTDDVIARMA